jgi:hypothetical protein
MQTGPAGGMGSTRWGSGLQTHTHTHKLRWVCGWWLFGWAEIRTQRWRNTPKGPLWALHSCQGSIFPISGKTKSIFSWVSIYMMVLQTVSPHFFKVNAPHSNPCKSPSPPPGKGGPAWFRPEGGLSQCAEGRRGGRSSYAKLWCVRDVVTTVGSVSQQNDTPHSNYFFKRLKRWNR